MTMPRFGDVIKIPGKDFASLPDTNFPYYFVAGNGMYLIRRLLFGRVAVKQKMLPDNFTNFETYTFDGNFQWDVDPIPAKIMGQTVSFFKRIYEKYHSEAIVLLTIDKETKEWGTFIPTQLNSGGGVNYVYERDHLSKGRLLVGSIHSHCNMGAFHSGTDTGDAEEFSGFHATIGRISNDKPEIVAMISLNGENIHIKAPDFPTVFDYSEIDQHPAPEWWDRYVGRNGDKPVGFELYEKYDKPKTAPPEKKTYTAPSTTWKDGKPTQHQSYGAPSNYQPKQNERHYESDEDAYSFWNSMLGRMGRSETLQESREFNRQQKRRGRIKWNADGSLKMGREHWEDDLPEPFVTAIVNMSAINNDEVEYAIDHPNEAGEPQYWIDLVLTKLVEAQQFLNQFTDTDFEIEMKTKPEPQPTKPMLLTDGRDSTHV